MANNLAKSTKRGEPPADPIAATYIAQAQSLMVDGEVIGGLPVAIRDGLQSRFVVLTTSFEPAAIPELEIEVSTVLSSWLLSRSIGAVEAKMTARAYAMALEDLPLWAVQRACRLIARGKVPGLSKDFPVSSARIHEVAEEIMEAADAEAKTIRKLLAAPVAPAFPEDHRERMKARFDELRATMRRVLPAVAVPRGDGKHALRVAADLEARKARQEKAA